MTLIITLVWLAFFGLPLLNKGVWALQRRMNPELYALHEEVKLVKNPNVHVGKCPRCGERHDLRLGCLHPRTQK